MFVAMTNTQYSVTGMTCGHCVASVREEVEKLAGVESVDVDLQSGLLSIASSRALSDAEVIAAVDEAGYEAAAI
jgi:copper chaperone